MSVEAQVIEHPLHVNTNQMLSQLCFALIGRYVFRDLRMVCLLDYPPPNLRETKLTIDSKLSLLRRAS